MQTWTDEALRALLCEELEAASYPVRRKQLIERSARRLFPRTTAEPGRRSARLSTRSPSRAALRSMSCLRRTG